MKLYHIFIDHFPKKTKGLFFLTHLHGDHIDHIPKTFTSIIYCSVITQHIMNKQRPEIKTQGVKLNDRILYSNNTFITLLNANHMKGSIMLFIEFNYKRILFTSDYRYHSNMLLPKCDEVYFDNIFHKKGIQMNTLSESLELLHKWMDAMFQSFDHIYIALVHIGTVDLLHHYFKKTGTQYAISSDCLSTRDFELMNMLWKPLINNKSNIHLISFKNIHKHKPILIPSAMWFYIKDNITQRKQIVQDGINKFRINYTQHSDYYDNEQVFIRTKPNYTKPIYIK